MIPRNKFERKPREQVILDAATLNLKVLGLATRMENGYNLNTFGCVL